MGTTPADAQAISRINHRHEAIILWLLTYPDRTLGDCAAYFGYTQPWLSRIIHTDMFQAAYRAKAEELGTATIHTIKDKLTNLAAITLEKATERIESGVASERFLGETMRGTLSALGYGSAPAQVDARSQNLHVHLDAETIIAARERAAQARSGSTPLKDGVITTKATPLPASEEENAA
jgi:hypothetical protein